MCPTKPTEYLTYFAKTIKRFTDEKKLRKMLNICIEKTISQTTTMVFKRSL